jgi:hypothetical protein
MALSARSRGLVADDSQSRGCGFAPWHRILDVMQAKLAIALKIKRNKGSQMGPTKKIFYKKNEWLLNYDNTNEL